MPNIKRIALLSLYASLVMGSMESFASEPCPPGIDPTYCNVANATGGKVYTKAPGETDEQMMNRMVSDVQQDTLRKQQQEAAERAAHMNRAPAIFDLHR